jgi:DMSO/TMAO reductase YedYZ molybdopterin-dependent catalytic subunit
MWQRLHRLCPWLALLALVTACAAAPLPGATAALAPPTSVGSTAAPTLAAATAATVLAPPPSACGLSPLAVPMLPAEIPGYAELDPGTGLHVTGHAQVLDLATYRLSVTGKVANPLSLTLDQLRCLPKASSDADLVCPGFFVDQARWTGAPLADVLELAGVQKGAVSLSLVGADGYVARVPLSVGREDGALLAYLWEGEALPVLHGYPVRAVFPGNYGSAWVKWLLEIQVR